jgi:FkbM family methyltransferase
MGRTQKLVDETLEMVANMGPDTEVKKECKGVYRTLASLLRRFGHTLLPAEYAERLKANQVAPKRAAGMLRELITAHEEFDAIYPLLADQESKELVDRLIRFRTAWGFLGSERTTRLFPAPLTLERYEEAIKACSGKSSQLGIPAKYVALLWELGHYSLKGVCEVEPGDTVMDIGAFRGDSALFFSEKCGSAGKVYAFEALPKHVAEIQAHADKADCPIEVVPFAAWDEPGRLNITSSGGESTVNMNGEGDGVDAETIDNIVRDREIATVDFIKMDIEGAEIRALKGAERTIVEHKPKLAISVYHLADDLYTIPNLLKAFNPDYTFYLRQYHPRHDETVLYAVP